MLAYYLLNFCGTAHDKIAKACPDFERGLAIWEKALGPDHPDTTRGLNNLAILAYYEEDLAEAARLMRRGLAIWEQIGANHPHTQSGRESLSVIESQLSGG
jgi:hypothetical protein